MEDLLALVRLGLTSRGHLAAENLFLRKQLALYQERHTKPRRPDPATRVALVVLSRWLDWRSMLTVVTPTWGEKRIADELRLKLGLTVSPRTVGRYLRRLRPSRSGQPAQRWATFVRNHAPARFNNPPRTSPHFRP